MVASKDLFTQDPDSSNSASGSDRQSSIPSSISPPPADTEGTTLLLGPIQVMANLSRGATGPCQAW